MIEGVDYSRTSWSGSPSVDALRANGKAFVGRYAVNDLSPAGRGITADEFRRMTAAGIDVFLYWQTTTEWMLGGFAAGHQGAMNAQANITKCGMPLDTPVYFACDFDAEGGQLSLIDQCLNGAASVLGKNRVGVYGGYNVIAHCNATGTARYFAQTSAWSGDGQGGILWHPAAHIHQYAYNRWIDGTNCDLVRATKSDYGQAQRIIPPPVNPYAKPVVPKWFFDSVKEKRPTDKTEGDIHYRVLRRNFRVDVLTTRRSKPDPESRVSGPKVDVNEKVFGERVVTVKGQRGYWIMDENGNYILGSKLSPKVALTPR